MKTRFAICACFISGSILLAGCRGRETYEKPVTPVRVQAVEEYYPGGKNESGEKYSANIQSSMQVELAFKYGGYVAAIHQVRGADGGVRYVQEGDRVPKGAMLARLRTEDFNAKVRQAESQLAEAKSTIDANTAQQAEAEAALNQAKRDLDRATRLLENRSLTKPEFEAASTRVQMAQAKHDAVTAQKKVIEAKINGAQSLVAEAKLAESDAVLRAPMDCFLLKRLIEPGMLATPGRPAFILAGRNSVRALFGAPDTTIRNIRPGMQLSLTTDAAPGVEFKGWVSRISPAADPKSRVFEVEVTIPRPPEQLRLGMIATVTLPAANAGASLTVVPINAIVRLKQTAENYAVNVVTLEGGKQIVRQRPVKLGEAFGNMIAVTSGLSIGERVVVSGSAMMVDGDPVRVIQ